jgi:hypothetical protein
MMRLPLSWWRRRVQMGTTRVTQTPTRCRPPEVKNRLVSRKQKLIDSWAFWCTVGHHRRGGAHALADPSAARAHR